MPLLYHRNLGYGCGRMHWRLGKRAGWIFLGGLEMAKYCKVYLLFISLFCSHGPFLEIV